MRAAILLGWLMLPAAAYADTGVDDQQTQTSSLLQLTMVPYCEFAAEVSGGQFGVLDFGKLGSTRQFTYAESQLGAGSIAFRCSSGLSLQILMNEGLHGSSVGDRQMRSGSGATLTYQLYQDAQRSLVWDDLNGFSMTTTGVSQVVPVFGQIPPQPTPAVGIYADEITVTLRY